MYTQNYYNFFFYFFIEKFIIIERKFRFYDIKNYINFSELETEWIRKKFNRLGKKLKF